MLELMLLLITIFPAMALLLMIIVFSFMFKNAEKKDKGFEIIYFKLSYRRKFFRTLISLPLLLLLPLIFYFETIWSFKVKIIIVTISILIFAIQLLYNFYMWKKNEP